MSVHPHTLWVVFSDAVIGLACLSMPFVFYAAARHHAPLRRPFWAAFSCFIAACGIGHLLEVAAFWEPVGWLPVVWGSITAVGAVAAFSMALPGVIRGASEEQLQRIARLEAEVTRATEELDRQKSFGARLIHHVPAGIAFLDRDLLLRWINPHLMDALGPMATWYLDRHLFDIAPQARAFLEPVLDKMLVSGEPFEATGLRLDAPQEARPRYWDLSLVPLLGRRGAIEGVLVFAVEVTTREENDELQRAQIAHLQELDRYKDEFLSVISHELRTPLNFIMGFASLMQEELAGPIPPAYKRHLDRILEGADRMLDLVSDLLDVAKLRAGKFDLAPAETAYVALLDDVAETMRPLAASRQLAIEVEADVPETLFIDGRRITQVLSNLVGNAVKFSEHGRIVVRARLDGDAILTEVTDPGLGIAPEQLARLFTPFEQLDMSSTRAAGGTGLGLTIVKALVEAHGGTVGVRSAPGAGSTFWFTLPLKRSDVTAV
jgi:signal transduction histidine kinase